MIDLRAGVLLVAPPSEDDDKQFGRTVVLVVESEPSGVTTGLVLNRRLERSAAEQAERAALFLPDPQAAAFWGGPMGSDAAILAEFAAANGRRPAGLEWFHLDRRERRPFPLPRVGLVALGEHPDAFAGRILRARLFVGMCVWGAGQLEAEAGRGEWALADATAEDVFTPSPEALWDRAWARAQARARADA